MRIQVMSDLHMPQWANRYGYRGYWQDKFPEETQTDADVLILAGDIVSLAPSQIQYARARLTEFGVRYKHVVYVPGNHEFYGTDIDAGMDDLLKMEPTIPGLHVLWDGRSVTIDGQRFVGGTGWVPRSAKGAPPINDHYCITGFEPDVFFEHEHFMEFMKKNLTSQDIVVSHHAPSPSSIDAQWKGDPCNAWFVAPDMERLILIHQPRLWVHGHTHTPFDYQLGQTRVICNPKGYPAEGVRFNPKLVIEVP